jgi:hypothetical protein
MTEEEIEQYKAYLRKKQERKAASLTESYPKLLAIGWNRIHKDTGTLIYLLEDEILFYGYAQNPKFIPRVKAGRMDMSAIRWCQGLILPKGNENVRKLYREALGIIKNDKTGDLMEIYLQQKKSSEEHGKEYTIDLEEAQEVTLADPKLSKYFL